MSENREAAAGFQREGGQCLFYSRLFLFPFFFLWRLLDTRFIFGHLAQYVLHVPRQGCVVSARPRLVRQGKLKVLEKVIIVHLKIRGH